MAVSSPTTTWAMSEACRSCTCTDARGLGCRVTRRFDRGACGRAAHLDRSSRLRRSTPDPSGNEISQADDVIALVDRLGIDRVAVLGWSSGGPTALALGARHADRVAVCRCRCRPTALDRRHRRSHTAGVRRDGCAFRRTARPQCGARDGGVDRGVGCGIAGGPRLGRRVARAARAHPCRLRRARARGRRE